MTQDWWFKFEFNKWRNDSKLRMCSLETQGFWLACICVMREMGTDQITGSYADIARVVGCFPEEASRCIVELKRTNAAYVTECNDEVTLVSRYIRKEVKAKEDTRLRVKAYREKHSGNAEVTMHSKSKSKSKSNKKEKNTTTTAKISDDEWLDSLTENPAYQQLNVRIEYERAKVWCSANNRLLTRRFFVGWINRAKPMEANGTGKTTNGNGSNSGTPESGTTGDFLKSIGAQPA